MHDARTDVSHELIINTIKITERQNYVLLSLSFTLCFSAGPGTCRGLFSRGDPESLPFFGSSEPQVCATAQGFVLPPAPEAVIGVQHCSHTGYGLCIR